ncbi:pilus assembly protein [Micromonospora yasonensis]|uniref:TadE/TadG family type IV pilus assembly protein n=1 Tax=Micromonospora yasonensis TaxID=1128667 RepID=UPI002231C654|nr:TadE/TadG family type IV pilus assembly protein [Micromonospora yasonensis]MCW3843789.1 pilus assembly protein [Micromonospora yasonensis]
MEFALLLPVVLLIIFGIIDFGRMLNAQITISQAAREGARAAALIDQGAGQDRVAAATRDSDLVDAEIRDCLGRSGPDTNASADVTYTFSYITPLGFIIGSGGTTLTAKSVMPCVH